MFGLGKTKEYKLLQAVKADNVNMVKKLLESVSIDVIYKDGSNLVRNCIENRAIKSLACVLEEGCDPNIKTNTGQVSIVRAADDGDIEEVKLLLKYNALINLYDFRGETALHTAAGKGALDIIRILVKAGADMNAMSKSGKTAEEIAIEKNQNHVVQYLKKIREEQEEPLLLEHKEEDVELTESNDNSVQHYWSVTDHQEITRIANNVVLNSRISQIFNFKSQSLLTVVLNKDIKIESILRENFENVSLPLIEQASIEYKEKTGENVVGLEKQAQPWNNLNKNSNANN